MAENKRDSTSIASAVERSIAALVQLGYAFVKTSAALLVPVPSCLGRLHIVRPRASTKLSPLAYLCICSFLASAFWPLAGLTIGNQPRSTDVAHTLHAVGQELSVGAVLVRSLIVMVPILFAAQLMSVALRLAPHHRRYVAYLCSYAFGTQYLLIPLVAIPLLFIYGSTDHRTSHVPPYGLWTFAAFPLLFFVHPVFYLTQSLDYMLRRTWALLFSPRNLFRLRRHQRLRNVRRWTAKHPRFSRLMRRRRHHLRRLVALTMTLSLVFFVDATVIRFAMAYNELQEIASPPRNRARLLTFDPLLYQHDGRYVFDIVVAIPNESDGAVFIERSVAVGNITYAGINQESRGWYEPAFAEALEWSGPPGPVLAINPRSAGWVKYRIEMRSKDIQKAMADLPSTPVASLELHFSIPSVLYNCHVYVRKQ